MEAVPARDPRAAQRDPRARHLVLRRTVGALPVPAALAAGRALRRRRTRDPRHRPASRRRACRRRLPRPGQRGARPHRPCHLPHTPDNRSPSSASWPRIARDPDYVRGNFEILDQALAGGRGVLAITGHVGNWELLAATVAARGYGVSVVARRVNDERFDALITRFRGDQGMEILLRDAPDFLGQVRGALAQNRIVAILMDQDSRGAGVFVPFFGRPAHTPPGAAVLALRTRVPVVTVFIHRRPEAAIASPSTMCRSPPAPAGGRSRS